MTMGHCKHGEFELTKGCPQCIAERQAAQEREDAEVNSPDNIGKRIKEAEEAVAGKEVPRLIVKVQYLDSSGVPAKGRDYSYFTAEPLAVGDKVQVPVYNRVQKAIVTAIDVPESEIAAFRDKVKTIPAGSKLTDQGPTVQAAKEPEQLQARLTLSESASEETKEAAAVLEEITGGQIQVVQPEPDQGPTEDPHGDNYQAPPELAAAVDKVLEEEGVPDQKPPALVTIETQVGRPFSGLFQLYQEAASLLQVAKKRVIATNEDLKPATDDLAIIATCKKAMFARKTEIVEPFKSQLDAINQAFGDLMFPVMEADRLTRGQVTTFDNEQRRKAAEAQRIEDEKFRLAKEEAALNGTGEITVPLGTAQAPPPVPEHTRTAMGTLGGRTNWKARVVDFAALDDQWKIPNESLLNSHARTTKGTRPIPGVEFYNDRSVTVRTR